MKRTVLGIVTLSAAALALLGGLEDWVSQDGWRAVLNLSGDTVTQYMGFGYQHTVATDTGGNVHVVWYDNRTGMNQVYYRKWSRSTNAWGPIVRVTNQTAPVYRPAIACDYSGNVHIVWYHSTAGYYGIWYKRWNVQTGTWGDSLRIHDPGGNYLNYYPSIACRPGGDNVHVVWYGRDVSNPNNFRVKHIEFTPGTGWGPVTIVDSAPTGTTEIASVAVDRWDSVYVVWRTQVSGNYQVFYRWRSGTGSWRSIEQVSNVNPNAPMYACAVAVDSVGSRVHVVWNGDVPGNSNDRIFYRSRTASGWDTTETVSIHPERTQYDPVVVVSSDGAVHVVWRGFTEVSTARMEILYRVKQSGVWGVVQQLTNRSSGGNVLTPAVAEGRYDDVNIVWYDNSDGDNDVYYIRGERVDAGVAEIISPSGGMERGAVVVPRAVWRNYSPYYQTDLKAFCFLVSPGGNRVYQESLSLSNVGPGEWDTLEFPSYVVNISGTWLIRCSTSAVLDKNIENDLLERSFTVHNHDIQAVQVLSPVDTVDTGTVIIPRAKWRNLSVISGNFTAFLGIYGPSASQVYIESLPVIGLAPQRDTVISFPSYRLAGPQGYWTVRCSTACLTDTFAANDTTSLRFWVRTVASTDIEMARILAPSGIVDTGTIVTPRGRWRNRTGNTATLVAYFLMFNPAAAPVYIESVVVNNLQGHQDIVLEFPSYRVPGVPGVWQARCSTVCLSDTWPENDTLGISFTVRAMPSWPYGWKEVKSMPLAPSNKGPGDGAWLTQLKFGGNRYLFALKGNKTGDFYLYDPIADTWRQLRSMPLGREAKPPRRASVGVAGGDYIYATKGNNTLGFWRYRIEDDSWEQLKDVPEGSGKRVKAGTDMVYVKRPHVDTGYVYLLKGYTDEFYRYNTVTGEWETLAPAPLTSTGRRWDRGSWIVYAKIGQNYYIYAHKSKYHELWKYDVLGDSWFSVQLRGMPYTSRLTGKSKKAKDGSAAAYYDGWIYALKGGNTCEFWRYDVAGDSWVEMDTMPSIGSIGKRKRVKGGGDIVLFQDGAFYALKGGKSPEFWRYYLADTFFAVQPHRSAVMNCARAEASRDMHIVATNPVVDGMLKLELTDTRPALVEIFDVSGRQVLMRQVGSRAVRLEIKDLRSGVYLLRVTTGVNVSSCKLVVK